MQDNIRILHDAEPVFAKIADFIGQRYSIDLYKKIEGNNVRVDYGELADIIINEIVKLKGREIPELPNIRKILPKKLEEDIYNVFYIIESIITYFYERKELLVDYKQCF